MATNRISGGSSIPTPSSVQQAPGVEVPQVTQKGPPADLRSLDLPPGTTLAGKSSPLSGTIKEGLSQLAKAEGWTAQQNALGVLVGAMTSARDAAPPEPDALTQMGFARLLKRHAPVERRAQADQDGAQLARLALVALGEGGLEGQRKSERGGQVESDLRVVCSAVADVMRRGEPERLENLAQDLAWIGTVLSGSKGARAAQTQVEAVAGMLEIMLAYHR